jgi:hypothetical protein
MSGECGEPLGRLEWRFWSSPAMEVTSAGGERLATPDGAQGASPSLPSSPSPASPRSLSSSMQNRMLKHWRKKSSQIVRDRACSRVLDESPGIVAGVSLLAIRPARLPSDLNAAGLKLQVLPPSTFPLENVIMADDWIVVQNRHRRTPPVATPASRNSNLKRSSPMVRTKGLNGKPTSKVCTQVRPTSPGLNPLGSRRSGLHRILGFHWNSHRGATPAAHHDRQATMAGRLPAGNFGAGGRGSAQPGEAGQSRQINGGGFSGNLAGANGGFGGIGPQGGSQPGFAAMSFGAGSGSSSQMGGQGNQGSFSQSL